MSGYAIIKALGDKSNTTVNLTWDGGRGGGPIKRNQASFRQRDDHL